MSVSACAALVERADPDRFRATMAAPVAARSVLFPLYAFNVEVSRAPWVTKEPMIAEMRLQWWRDALEEIGTKATPRKHDVVDALADILTPDTAGGLDDLIAARRWDIYTDAFADAAALDAYINATSGHLMWTAARLLGDAPEATIRDFAYGAGIANLLRAIPALEDLGRKPLVDGRESAVAALAHTALERLNRAAAARRDVPISVAPALAAGWKARTTLTAALRDPHRVAQGNLDTGPIRDSLRLAQVARFGWWR